MKIQGHIIDHVMDVEGIGFPEAVKVVYQRIGTMTSEKPKESVTHPWAWSTGPVEDKRTSELLNGCEQCPCMRCKEVRLKQINGLAS